MKFVQVWPWWYDIGTSWHSHVSWKTHAWNIQILLYSGKLWSWLELWLNMQCDLELGNMTQGQSHDILYGHGSKVSRSGYEFRLCALWAWPLKYALGSRLSHNPLWLTSAAWNIQIQYGWKEKLIEHGFWLCATWHRRWINVVTHPLVRDNNGL